MQQREPWNAAKCRAQRGYRFDDFGADAESAGLQFDLRLATWDLRPWTPKSDFLVAVLRPDR